MTTRSTKPYDVQLPFDGGAAENIDSMFDELYQKVRVAEAGDEDLNARFPVTETDGGTGETEFDKGDVLVGDGTGLQRLAVGADGALLTADAGEPLGVKWAAPASSSVRDLLTDGDTTEPELVFAGGDVVWVETP